MIVLTQAANVKERLLRYAWIDIQCHNDYAGLPRVTTARKKSDAEKAQEVPVALTAFGAAQLDALFVKKLDDLSYKMPNVQLEAVGTFPGVQNFSIRGQGINSSIPSVDPTVGVFVDGVFLGTTYGGDGRTTFAFPGATPERDLWETYARIVSKLRPGLGLIANVYAGTGEPNGDDDRPVPVSTTARARHLPTR